ncbi:MAG: universal stress protein [Halobacteriota archaeon]
MYRRILIPTDGSAGARKGAEQGLTLAAESDATVHTLFVVDDRVWSTPALSSDELFLEQVEAQGEDAMAVIAQQAEELGLETERACLRGRPDEVIRRYAAEHDIDLIVMGLHGQSKHPRPHPGSCTDSVIHRASVPVLPV